MAKVLARLPKVVAVARMFLVQWLIFSIAAFTDAARIDLDLSQCTDPQAWADNNTFFCNDTLVVEFPSSNSFLEVNKTASVDCHTTNPIREYNSPAVIKLREPGERHFIVGEPGNNCLLMFSVNATSGTRLASGKTIYSCLQQKLLSSTMGKLNEAPAPSPGPLASVAPLMMACLFLVWIYK